MIRILIEREFKLCYTKKRKAPFPLASTKKGKNLTLNGGLIIE
jgi:hypothetical protein